MFRLIQRPHKLTAHKRRLNDDSSDTASHHVAGQKFLNKSILTKISSALNEDPAADLTVLLSDVSTSYPSKRRKATETRTSTREGGILVVSTLGSTSDVILIRPGGTRRKTNKHPTFTKARDTLSTRSSCLGGYGPF